MTVPGLQEAQYVQNKIRELGIQDVQLFFDEKVEPNGMWVMCQVMNRTNRLIIPDNYAQDNIKPYIMWYIKTNDGHFRLPNENDISDVIATRTRAEKVWEKGGDWLADHLDDQSKEKDRKHHQKLKNTVHDIAPAMKQAIRKENL